MHAVQDSKLLSVLSCQYNIPVDLEGLIFGLMFQVVPPSFHTLL